ncbi:MAG: AraC family transcriptional regulator [Myxococcota bacterium]
MLSGALDALRVSGSLVLNHCYGAPWAVDVPGADELQRLCGAERDARAVAFHLVHRGPLLVRTPTERCTVESGAVVACFGGQPHRLGYGANARSVALADVLGGHARPPLGDDGGTHLSCGVLVLRDAALHPLLAALPNLVVASTSDGDLDWIGQILRRELQSGGEGSAFIVDRMLETLCAGVLRGHLARTPEDSVGWFRGLADPQLSRALEQVHREPGAPWSVEALARVAGTSRSRFAARFAQLVGQAPMTYVARWRMSVAARLLRRSDRSVAEVASAVGYDSVPAFARVFRRHVGASPAAFRRGRTG